MKAKVKKSGSRRRHPRVKAALVGKPPSEVPPLYSHTVPRVEVAKVCGDRAGRERVYKILRQVNEWGVLRDIAVYIRVEKGAAARGVVGWNGMADKCHAAIHCGFQLFDELAFLVMQVVQGTSEFVDVPEEPTTYEKIVLASLQEWLDAVTASPKRLHGFMCEILAGFGGCDVQGLRRFNASSGVEAAFQLSWSVRNAVARQSEHPFLWMGLVEGQGRRATPARGRSCPESPTETDSDDRSILLAVTSGESSSKGIASKSERLGRAVKDGHVRKRKFDLVRWELVDGRSRPWRLTTKGVEWVRAMQGTNGSSLPST